MDIATILAKLKTERDQLDRAITALEHVPGSSNRSHTRRKISAKGLARIRAAQRARWAKVRGEKKTGKRTRSTSARRKIAAAQRARWAKLKRLKKAGGKDRATRL